ncbi:serine/threonine-protein kinase pim-2-like [Oratosquilla oratoria]|uniref:serine/threonine-protein kinase pim-2-like n=1 Tax=Oratosquilla oratoria TaxID=337810 RepID=UPI003F757350
MPLEVALMKTVHHVPEVIKLLDFFMERRHVFVLMELIAGAMDLRAYTSKHGELNLEEAKNVFLHVVRAMSACHEAGVSHQDIKMANILAFRDNENKKMAAKLIDFGMGSFIKDSSPRYEESAVWSLGYLLFRLVCKHFPNDGEKWELKFPKGVPTSCQKLIKKCLTSKPVKRLRLGAIKADSWLTGKQSQKKQKSCATPCPYFLRDRKKVRTSS